MKLFDLFLIALALSLDAFSVSITCGTRLGKDNFRKFIKIALAFGIFQSLMPLLGFCLTKVITRDSIFEYSKWISFLVFLILSLKLFYDYSKSKKDDPVLNCQCSGYRCLTSLAIATSIDAFVIGSVLAITPNVLFLSVGVIGVITFFNSLFGCLLGNLSVLFLKNHSRLFAGLILFFLALKSVA